MDELTVDMIGQACATFGQIYDIKLCQLLSLWTYAPYKNTQHLSIQLDVQKRQRLLHTNLSPKTYDAIRRASTPCFYLMDDINLTTKQTDQTTEVIALPKVITNKNYYLAALPFGIAPLDAGLLALGYIGNWLSSQTNTTSNSTSQQIMMALNNNPPNLKLRPRDISFTDSPELRCKSLLNYLTTKIMDDLSTLTTIQTKYIDDLVEIVDGTDMFIQYGHWTLQYGENMPNNHFGRHKKSVNSTQCKWVEHCKTPKTTGQIQELFAAIGVLKTLAMQYTVAELTRPQAQITDWFTLPTDIFINKYDDYITNGWIVITDYS